MAVRIGILIPAHVHTGSYVHCLKRNPNADLIGLWDDDIARGESYAKSQEIPFFSDFDTLMAQVDAVAITSENLRHAELIERTASQGKHILCEKPLAASEQEEGRIRNAVESSGVRLMTAFPCRFSPAFQRLIDRVTAGEIGSIQAVCATNRGTCPGGWFTEPEKSGGGAMIDHVVHVADLLRVLLKSEPARVQAQIGSNMYCKDWDDTAMVTIEFESGVFCSLDSSWSRPKGYKTWGDVTMNVVGDAGVIELDMFGPGVDVYSNEGKSHVSAGYVSDLDYMMFDEFVQSILANREPSIGMHDGLQAARVAIKGYESAKLGQPVSV
ncbi:MAG TPA: Gfo/Idh/MocA family oxidoreductase [Fimbriimonadaceae bacterium]|nr:Gfo/Idh/MocA family oxidoreductase [Fimbriimonadaceae bacterium]